MKKFLGILVNGYMGLLFPLIMTIILLEKLHHLISPLVQLIEDKLHISRFLGVFNILLISVVVMILLGYLAGLLMRSSFVKRKIEKFEENILSRIPIYNLIKSIFSMGIGGTGKNDFHPALLQDGESFSLCYVTSESEDFYTVYVSEGGLSGGELKIVPKKLVRLLNMSLMEFTRIVKQYGMNSAQYAQMFLDHSVNAPKTAKDDLSNDSF